jgi:hypothetical protein
MNNRLIEIKLLLSCQGKNIPLAIIVLTPVKRSLPVILFHRIPTVGQPVIRFLIPTGFDEFQVFTVRDRLVSQFIWLEPYFMIRPFIIKSKPFAVVPDFNETSIIYVKG